MNIRIVIYFLGWLLDFEGAFLLLPCFIGLIYREEDALYFALSSLICLVLGFIITRFRPKDKSLYAREGFVIVALSWFLLSLFGALPFVMSGAIPSFVDAVFETASGFTTTGLRSWRMWERCPRQLTFGGPLPTGSAAWVSWYL